MEVCRLPLVPLLPLNYITDEVAQWSGCSTLNWKGQRFIILCNHTNRSKNNRRGHHSFTWFIFNPQREKYVQYFTIICSRQPLCVRTIKGIPFLGWWPMAISARCEPCTDGHCNSGPVLKIDYPVSHKPLASPLPRAWPPFQPHTPTYLTKFNKGRQHRRMGCLLHPIQHILHCLILSIVAIKMFADYRYSSVTSANGQNWPRHLNFYRIINFPIILPANGSWTIVRLIVKKQSEGVRLQAEVTEVMN